MALLFCDGFDRYQNTADLTTQGWVNDDSTNITLDTTGSQWGGKALKMGDLATAGTTTTPGIARPFTRRPTGTVLRMAFWIKTAAGQTFASGLTGGEALFTLNRGRYDTAKAENFSAMVNTSGAIDIFKFESLSSNARELIGTGGTIAINDGNWHHFELEFTINTSTGSVKTWVDGVADYNTTGVDTTDASGDADVSWLNVVKLSGGKRAPGASDAVWFDDVIIWDDDTTDSENTMSGALPSHTHRIETKTPNSDNSVQFTRSTGAVNYANVDDIGPYNSDTDYNSSTTNNHTDLLGMATSSVFADAVYAVNVVAVVRKTSASAGIPRVRAKAKNVATTRSSEAKSVWNTTYTVVEFPMCKDPNTGSAWDHTTLQSTVFGYERLT